METQNNTVDVQDSVPNTIEGTSNDYTENLAVNLVETQNNTVDV